MDVPVLSVQIHQANTERTVGPLIKLVEALSATVPEKLDQLRREAEKWKRWLRNTSKTICSGRII